MAKTDSAVGRSSECQPSSRLDSWKEIAEYLNRSVRTVIRWESDEGLPVHRIQHDKRGSVYAWKTELDAWQASRRPSSATTGDHAPGSRRSRRYCSLGATTIVLFSVATIAAVYIGGREQLPPTVARLTTLNGMELSPSLSPDGRLVAFSWTGLSDDNEDIYVQLIGSATPLRLTAHRQRDGSPVWSPDGQSIAFVRYNSNSQLGIHIVPALGGPERELGVVSRNASNFPLRISWTPEGKWIVVPHLTTEFDSALYLLSVDGAGLRQMTFPPKGTHDTSGVVSPNGRMLAFLRSADSTSRRVHISALTDGYRTVGQVHTVGRTRYSLQEPIWSSDSKYLYYVLEVDGVNSMWKQAISGGEAIEISSGWPAGWTHAAIGSGQRVVLTDGWRDMDLWRFDLSGKTGPARFLSSTASDINPQYSPDGRSIAFASRRSGSFQIWLADANGTNERQLTSLASTVTGMPRWSPDGTRIAFDARVEGNEGVWVIAAQGGEPVRLTIPPATGFNPSWSSDGRWIYFCSRRSGQPQIWKMLSDTRASGRSEVQVTKTGAWNGTESPDGRYLYYVQANDARTLSRLDVKSGKSIEIADRIDSHHNIAVVSNGAYFGRSLPSGPNQSIWFYSCSSGTSVQVMDAGRPGGLGLTVAPDGRSLVTTLVESRGGDLWLIERSRQ